jgi:DNA-binding transcriptional LysR family regulator
MPASRTDKRTQQVHAATAGSSPPTTGLGGRVELRQLRYFVAVAGTLHFGRAAKALHISQPPLSLQVRDLESCIGVRLFNRSAKGVTLTEAGAIFLPKARMILSDVSLSIRMAQRAAAGERGRLAIAFDPFFDSVLLGGIRDRFARDHPDVRVTFHRVDSEDQAALIRGGSLDAGFLIAPVADADKLILEPLFREPAVALVSASHPLSARREVALKDLARFPLMELRNELGEPAYCHASRIGTMCEAPLPVDRAYPAFEKLPRLLCDSTALALLPASVRDLCGEGVRCITISDPGADFTLGLLYDRSRVPGVLARFIELARQYRTQPPEVAAAWPFPGFNNLVVTKGQGTRLCETFITFCSPWTSPRDAKRCARL